MKRPGTKPNRPWLLISDVDDTLTGDAAGLQSLCDAILRNHSQLWLALNSSRPRASVARTLQQDFPPAMVPDAMITALGTEIYVEGQPVDAWHQRFRGWPQREVFDLLSALGHRPHDDEFQTPNKVSFAVAPGAAQTEARAELERHSLPCRIVASGADDFDVIPPNAGKAAAALYLAEILGNSPDQIIVAGDSGNDLEMFRIAQRAIAVANARDELLAAMPTDTAYIAKRPHAAGVLEGLVHFGVIP